MRVGRGVSITGRLTAAVLLLEVLAALALIGVVTNHERRVQFTAFDANLRANANALLGAVQEADGQDGSIRLDLRGMEVPRRAAFRVMTENGKVLGERGSVPAIPQVAGTTFEAQVEEHPFRFYVLKGQRVIDPNSASAVNHEVTVVYGLPEGRTWHAVFEATQFFAVATLALLGVTAGLMWWLVRRFLRPIRDLALEAEKVDVERWVFEAPASSVQFEELRPLAAALEKTVERLHRSFAQQRRFTSDAAHELKTDLAIVKSSVQLLAMKRRTADEYERGLAAGLEDIARMETTVQTMLTLARVEQGERGAERCDLGEAMRATGTQMESYARGLEVELTVEATGDRVMVGCGSDEARMLCANVVMNAVQHSGGGERVKMSLARRGAEAELRIRDHGEGVREEDVPHLFEAFYRGDASRSRQSGGTGLGLSICRAICERAGGSIAIGNHAGGGAEVVIRLPVLED